ncbi:MAG: peptidylprolyl isomerase [Epulopiscium sp. Nele67-Bin002]|nr:MAG: peptidylprolyl isomerase [Epulopiscium sp. Nele67-Bin002]
MNNQVVATVNGKDITEKDVNSLLRSLGQQGASLRGPEGRKKLIDELVAQELFYLNALEQGDDKDEEFLIALEEMKVSLLKQYALNKVVAPISATDDEVREYFDTNKQMFVQPPVAKASHILVKTKEEIDNIAAEISGGKSFEDAAREYSQCPSKERGGDLGEFSPGMMVPEFEKVAFSMEPNQISEPLQTPFGYHIIKLDYLKEGGEPKFEEYAPQIKETYLNTKRQNTYMDWVAKLMDRYEVKVHE